MKIIICRVSVGQEWFYALHAETEPQRQPIAFGASMRLIYNSRRELISRIRERYRHEKHLRIIDETT